MNNKTDCKKKHQKRILPVLFYSFLFSPLFFYLLFFDRPELPFWIIVVPLYCFWIAMLFLDMQITLSIKQLILQYEANLIFRILYEKYRVSVAVFLQLLIEALFIFALPSLMFPRDFGVKLFFDYQSSAIFAGIVGVIHLIAWQKKKKNIKDILDDQKFR